MPWVVRLNSTAAAADGWTVERLRANVQHYDWGDPDFIPALQSRSPSGRPEAELWMGAHPASPSRIESSGVALDALIAADPIGTLGADVAERFGALPFLAKILAAAEPLSIQAHPSATQAREGFERENREGIALSSPRRVYSDPHHKPELMCALTRFEAKCGFRPLEDTVRLFAEFDHAGVRPLAERFDEGGRDADVLADVLAWLLSGSTEVAAVVTAVAEASAAIDTGPFAAEHAWTTRLDRGHHGDPGIVIALLLNHVVLEPGQAVFLGAGNLHSYLRGCGVELMANSDNVVRGGLTTKHVDTDELLRVVDCTPMTPPVQTADDCIHTFDTPVPEFRLTRVSVRDDVRLRVDGPEIIIVTEGLVEFVAQSGEELASEPGTPIWVPASEGCYLARGGGVFYRARVG